MQKCSKCGKPVKYIAIGQRETAICEDVEKVFITEMGRRLKGYEMHKCEGVEEWQKEK